MKEKHGELINIQWNYDDAYETHFIRGHVTIEEAQGVINQLAGDESGKDYPHTRHRWGRWTPAPLGCDYKMMFSAQSENAKGCFAVTEISMRDQGKAEKQAFDEISERVRMVFG